MKLSGWLLKRYIKKVLENFITTLVIFLPKNKDNKSGIVGSKEYGKGKAELYSFPLVLAVLAANL